MKKITPLLLFLCFTIVSCTHKEEAALKPSEIKAKVDSLVDARRSDIKKAGDEDLDLRIAIEVKPKADSIVAANMKKNTVDTSKTTHK